MDILCEIDRCPDPAEARGWCRMHYQRWYRHGDPLALVRAPETGGIYEITGPEGCIYIGSSDNVRRRWKAHKARLRRRDHHNRLLQASWDEHGEAAFTFALLEEIADPAQLIPAEQRHLDTAKEAGRAVFNLTSDIRSPARGLVHTPGARLKMSDAAKAACLKPDNLAGKRRRVQGDRNPGSKLDESTVRGICDRLLAGAHPAELAAEVGVSESAVYQIRRGQIWTHVVTPELAAAMKAVRQNGWAKREVTDEHRARFAAVGRANRGSAPSAARREQISQQSRGAGNPKAKLTEEQVAAIRRLLAAGARNKDLAGQFGVHPNTISKIKSGVIWPHVTT
ncbi:GIY-YIG nuclease family protein [Streptacidiphilus carbonis]|uniref:GIY-YIG nuclease family protein n=1 Tax=Streptacidiphilus carbonis TaxID=105422 RepID=UPI001376D9E7|nr:GIY-YIG nuclease family protein [Streptacidiphilus carbonis]